MIAPPYHLTGSARRPACRGRERSVIVRTVTVATLGTIILGLTAALAACNGPGARAEPDTHRDEHEPVLELSSPEVTTPNAPELEHRELVRVPGGPFYQESTNGASFEHTLSDFEIAKYAVTYELWYEVRSWAEERDPPYQFANPGREGSDGVDGASPTDRRHQPATRINWFDAVVWLNAYSELNELTPVYRIEDEPVRDATRADREQTVADWDADGFRLPTEGEWQYAASWRGEANGDGGRNAELREFSGRFWTPPTWASGAAGGHLDSEATGAVAWYMENTDENNGTTQPVGTREPNQLGLYDMSGNTWEWTWDWYAAYPDQPQTDYRGPDAPPENDGPYRVLRGASVGGAAVLLQVGYRIGFAPANADFSGGIRPARNLR